MSARFNVGDYIQVVHNLRVERVSQDSILVKDVEKNITMTITGQELLNSSKSANYARERKSVTKSEIVKQLLKTNGGIFSVTFKKADGSSRTLNGYLVKEDDGFGRSYCIDLELQGEPRLVDHRTISNLVFDGVEYFVR